MILFRSIANIAASIPAWTAGPAKIGRGACFRPVVVRPLGSALGRRRVGLAQRRTPQRGAPPEATILAPYK